MSEFGVFISHSGMNGCCSSCCSTRCTLPELLMSARFCKCKKKEKNFRNRTALVGKQCMGGNRVRHRLVEFGIPERTTETAKGESEPHVECVTLTLQKEQ